MKPHKKAAREDGIPKGREPATGTERPISIADEIRRQRDEFVGAVLDSLTSGVAVVDRGGTITAVNQAWRDFASENSGDPAAVSVGVNYLEVTDAASARGDEVAARAAAGIRVVLSGEAGSVTLEYPCHSPSKKRWFLMTVSPLRTREGGVVIIHLDITRRREAEELARRSDERFRATFERVTVGVAHVNPDGLWLRVNPRLCAILGYSEGELLGRPMLDISHPEDRIAEMRQFQLLKEGGVDSYSMEKRYLAKSGAPIWISVTAGAQNDPQGNLEYIVVIAEDISERAATAAELRSAAEEAKRVKADFLANVSHELRTPMNVIIGMTELALAAELSPTVREYLQTAKESAAVLLHLLNDILDFSKIEAGRFELEKTPFALRDVLDETVRPFAARAAEKGLDLRVDVSPEVPRRLLGDPLRLRQVLSNLLSNAVKFTDAGEVSLDVTREAEEGGAIALQFTVADTGIGVSPEDQARIFEPFAQADTSTTRRFGGSGLGLAISSELISMMRGRLWIESEPGKGSRFHFDARFSRPGRETAEKTPERRRPIDPGPHRSLRVLVAEDISTNRMLVREVLTQRGHTVGVARNGRQAVERIAREAFDVILMDVQMPVLDGLAAAREIRELEDPQRARTPIVAVTAHAMRGDRERCLAAGMDAYISKPLDAEKLFELLETLAERQSTDGRAPVDSRVTANATAPNDGAIVDLDRALARVGGNRRLLADMIRLFREDVPELLREIRAGLEANDAARVRRASHSLKGLASNFDAQVATASADTLQKLAEQGRLAGAGDAVTDLERAVARLIDRLDELTL